MKAYLLSLFSLVSIALYAQHRPLKRNAIGFSAGWQQLKFIDQHASPLLYEGSIVPVVGLHYAHRTENSFFKVKLDGGKGSANPRRFGARNYTIKWNDTSSYSYQVSSFFANANLEATYLRKLHPSAAGNAGYWIGATINESAYYADEVANFPWIMNAADISPAFRMDYRLSDKQQLGVGVDFAAISVVTRAVYGLFAKSAKDKNVAAYFKQGTRFATPYRYHKATVNIFYRYEADRVAFGANYRFKWIRYPYPKPVRATDRRFDLNAEYVFN